MAIRRTIAEFSDDIATADIADDAITGGKLANDIAISTTGAITTTGAFTSVGIDDDADAVSIKIDANENVGFGGVTLETDWNANHDAIQIGLGGSLSARDNFSQTVIANNARCTGEDWATSPKYINAGQASAYAQWNIGTHRFLVSNESGSADGTITWKEAMTIINSGNVGIGTSSPDALLHIDRGTTTSLGFRLYSNTGNTQEGGPTPIALIENDGAGDAYAAFGLTGVATGHIGMDHTLSLIHI